MNTQEKLPQIASEPSLRVLIVDLNNFSLYPTMAVGYLAAILRRHGFHVTVLSPLAHDISGVVREPPETVFRDIGRRFSYALAQAPGTLAGNIRALVEQTRMHFAFRNLPRIGEIFARTDPSEYDVVLVSTYLMHYSVCREIGQLCRESDVPLLVGGSYFAEAEVARSWLDIPGLHALIGGEVELELPDLVRQAANKADLSNFPGVWLPDGSGSARAPLIDLDAVPFPDYSDFPWEKYPARIVPLLTGRGCGWGVCTFCSDVTSTSGRSFRSRSIQNVLDEIVFQSHKHGTSLFVFTDLKLNSDLSMWNAIISKMAGLVESPRWIGSVHVDSKTPNGLDLASLERAKSSGAVRLTTGLESGSQRVLDRWAKGTDLNTTAQFLRDAAAARISVRVTMIHGAPGETVADVEASADFLERHAHLIDRVRLNRFQIMIGPSFLRRFDQQPSRFPTVKGVERHARMGIADHQMTGAYSGKYFMATQRLMKIVHNINRKALPPEASIFAGVM